MARPSSSSSRLPAPSQGIVWRPTKIMNMRDLSKDDDFLSHLLVEKLGTGTVPLLVHKMDSSRRLPKTDTHALIAIVRNLVAAKGPLEKVIRAAVDELLKLSPIRYYLKSYTQKQINAFATHASRYFELYHPSGSIEIAHTSRYSHHTGKSELCILATRNLPTGTVVTELKGSMANLTEEEDKELKRTDLRNSDIRRDFSVIHSKSMKKNHLFLGPARFVNHDCDNNCELFREGKYITFRTLRPIAIGEEITAHYGDGYFGKRNRHCLCETCEKNGKGGYSPDHQTEEPESSDSSSGSGSDSDSDSDTSSSDTDSEADKKPVLNVNERRTRRGVYAVTKPEEDETDDSDNEEEDEEDGPDKIAQGDGEIELTAELDTGSELTSLATSSPPSDGSSPVKLGTPDLMTPNRNLGASPVSSSLTELTSSTRRSTPKSNHSTPFRSIIATRRQRAVKADSETPTPAAEKGKGSKSTNATPPCAAEPTKRLTRSVSSMMLSESKRKGKGKGKATPTPTATPRSGWQSAAKKKDEVSVKKEEVDTRLLRVRPNVPEPPKEPPKPDIPRGPDGNPLPTCSTCSNVLPLIAVDSKVVWGLGAEASKKKKNVKQDCPRCLRHFAIYQRPWPSRIAPRGAVSETPREETPVEVITKKVTHKGLPVLDRKLAAAASASASTAGSRKSNKRARAEEAEEQEQEQRTFKRRKSEPEPVLQKTKVIRTYSSSASKKVRRFASPSPVPKAAEEPEPAKRKRGRPRLSTPAKVKVEDSAEADKACLSQPRSNNGRFGRKDRRKSGDSMSSSGSPQKKRSESPDDERALRRSKRSRGSLENEVEEELPRKKAAAQVVDDDAVAPRILPRPMSGFRGGRLFSNPNPLQYARHAWAQPVVVDDSSSSDEEKQPETPDDVDSLAAGVASPEEDVPSFVPTLTYNPSPFVYAKTRWNGKTNVVQPFAATIGGKQPYEEDRSPSPLLSERSPSPDVDDYASMLGIAPPNLPKLCPLIHPPATATIALKSTILSKDTDSTPTFIHAGWDNASDVSET